MKTALSTQEAKQARVLERRPCRRSVRYAVAAGAQSKQPGRHFTGNVVDFSNRGVGIETDTPLAPGHTLWLLDSSLDASGIIRWCRETAGSYRAGVEFITRPEYGAAPSAKEIETVVLPAHDPSRQLSGATELFLGRLREIEDEWFRNPGERSDLLPSITSAFNDVLAACARFEEKTPDINTVRQMRRWFHEKTDSMLGQSRCIHRARTWPQGHQGDYKTLELIYKDSPLSPGFGRLLDRSVMSAMLAEAVRKRISKLSDILAEELSSRSRPAVLNIACGSCREVMAVVPEIAASNARFTCVDSDGDALDFALDRLANAGVGSHMTFRKYNALRMFDDELNRMEFGKQDVIYSLGLFDYLPSDFLVKMFRALFALLSPGGTFIAAFKDAERYRHQDYHWIFDWDGFQQRRVSDFRKIIDDAGINSSFVGESRDDTGIIAFYRISKQG